MKELKKENVAVKVTAKNAEKLRKLFAMFPNEKADEHFIRRLKDNEKLHFYPFASLFSERWYRSDSRALDGKTLVTWKQLRAILAKEHLKAGDWVVCENKEIGVTEIIRVSHVDNESIHMEEWADLGGKTTKQGSGSYYLKYFKRYATTEEVQYFDNPHAEVRAAFEKGAKVEVSHPSDNVWHSVTEPKWSKELQYRIAEDNPVGKWCEFWDDDIDDKTVRKYGELGGGVTYPHRDLRGRSWKNYSLIPEPMQTQLSNL